MFPVQLTITGVVPYFDCSREMCILIQIQELWVIPKQYALTFLLIPFLYIMVFNSAGWASWDWEQHDKYFHLNLGHGVGFSFSGPSSGKGWWSVLVASSSTVASNWKVDGNMILIWCSFEYAYLWFAFGASFVILMISVRYALLTNSVSTWQSHSFTYNGSLAHRTILASWIRPYRSVKL